MAVYSIGPLKWSHTLLTLHHSVLISFKLTVKGALGSFCYIFEFLSIVLINVIAMKVVFVIIVSIRLRSLDVNPRFR